VLIAPSLKALPSRWKGVAKAVSTDILFLILLVLSVNPVREKPPQGG